jgi:hypothetical protein
MGLLIRFLGSYSTAKSTSFFPSERLSSQFFKIGFRVRLPDIPAQFVTSSRYPSIERQRAWSEGPFKPKHGVGPRLFNDLLTGGLEKRP